MKSHPLSMKTVYEIFDKKGGELIYTSENHSIGKAEIRVKINNPGQPERIITFPFRSYVSNFLRVLNNAFLNVDNSTAGNTQDKLILTTAGGVTYPAATIHTMAVNEGALTGAAQTAYGIWIGDLDNLSGLGLTSETGIVGFIDYNNYRLRTLILANGGTPDTDVNYLATGVTLKNDDQTLEVSRRFQNVGSTDIKVTEIGMVGKSGTDYFLLARDRVTDGTNQYFPLNAAGTIEVTYSFTITDSMGLTTNYLKYLSSEFTAANAISQVRDTGNVAQTINFSSARTQKDLLASAGVDTYGIIAGLDEIWNDDPNTFITNSAKLFDNPIAHGSTIDTLDYGAVVPVILQYGNQKTSFGFYRDFENKYTAGSKYVSYSAVVIRQGTSPYTYYMLANSYIPARGQALIIAPNQVLRVKYTFEAPL